ncbi:MAG: PilZ domain-containing protein [Myxococcales bacterium]|nr:PilZ domain-containing protein [Myxococcales bacterium]
MSSLEHNEEQHTADNEAGAAEAKRARLTTRIPFDGVVEVGGELGPPFEAQAVDVSGTGMHLRTAYLPEVGQALSCRFEAGRETVVATGEVVWQKEAGRGGEFGLRFVDLDRESAAALERMTDRARLRVPGAKVRLHIDGLGAPMRARVRGTDRSALTVGSDLAFLQVGKHIDLEDAESGSRRPALIDRVDVEVDPSSRVPQLVVSLKYEQSDRDCEAEESAMADTQHNGTDTPVDPAHNEMHAAYNVSEEHAAHETDVAISEPQPGVQAPARSSSAADDVMREELEASARMKGPVARAASKVTPALERFAKRARTATMLLVEKAKARRSGDASPIRRTTAPAPGGGLHTAGRKVVRGESMGPTEHATAQLGGIMSDKKKVAAIGVGAVLLIAIGAAALNKKSATPEATAANTAAAPATPDPAAAPVAAPVALPPGPAPVPVSGPIEVTSGPAPGAMPPPVATEPATHERPSAVHETKSASKKPIKVTPFANGHVSRGNLLRLKMDGAIDKIQGAQQPTGFTVHIPGRRSLEPAAPLAARDARIGAIKVANDQGGAELSVTFKDGVPNYLVRAKGDQLEIVLASPSAGKEAPQKKDAKPGAVAKRGHGKHGKH